MLHHAAVEELDEILLGGLHDKLRSAIADENVLSALVGLRSDYDGRVHPEREARRRDLCFKEI